MSRLLRLLFVLCGLTPALAAAGDDWEQVREARERTDVAVWVKPVPGNPLNAFRGVTEVPYPPLTALAVLVDVENFPKWVFQCHAAHLMPEHGNDIAYFYIKGIWPVSDRDGVVRSTLSQDPDTLALTVHSTVAEGLKPEQDGVVRLPALDNRFRIEPLTDGWTRITFETFVDPGGMIPAWLANLVATKAPLTTLQKMQVRMRDSRYHLDHISELPVQLPGLEQMTVPGGAPLI